MILILQITISFVIDEYNSMVRASNEGPRLFRHYTLCIEEEESTSDVFACISPYYNVFLQLADCEIRSQWNDYDDSSYQLFYTCIDV